MGSSPEGDMIANLAFTKRTRNLETDAVTSVRHDASKHRLAVARRMRVGGAVHALSGLLGGVRHE
jgi:hypothetical protein